jgi:hypothetical protein
MRSPSSHNVFITPLDLTGGVNKRYLAQRNKKLRHLPAPCECDNTTRCAARRMMTTHGTELDYPVVLADTCQLSRFNTFMQISFLSYCILCTLEVEFIKKKRQKWSTYCVRHTAWDMRYTVWDIKYHTVWDMRYHTAWDMRYTVWDILREIWDILREIWDIILCEIWDHTVWDMGYRTVWDMRYHNVWDIILCKIWDILCEIWDIILREIWDIILCETYCVRYEI